MAATAAVSEASGSDAVGAADARLGRVAPAIPSTVLVYVPIASNRVRVAAHARGRKQRGGNCVGVSADRECAMCRWIQIPVTGPWIGALTGLPDARMGMDVCSVHYASKWLPVGGGTTGGRR